jgi:hypothetical protein
MTAACKKKRRLLSDSAAAQSCLKPDMRPAFMAVSASQNHTQLQVDGRKPHQRNTTCHHAWDQARGRMADCGSWILALFRVDS